MIAPGCECARRQSDNGGVLEKLVQVPAVGLLFIDHELYLEESTLIAAQKSGYVQPDSDGASCTCS